MLLHSSAEFAYIWTGLKRYLLLRSCFGWFLFAWNQCWIRIQHGPDVRFFTLILIPDPYWKTNRFLPILTGKKYERIRGRWCFVLNYKTSINKRPKGPQSCTWVPPFLKWNTCWLWSAEKQHTHTQTWWKMLSTGHLPPFKFR